MIFGLKLLRYSKVIAAKDHGKSSEVGNCLFQRYYPLSLFVLTFLNMILMSSMDSPVVIITRSSQSEQILNYTYLTINV